MLSHEVEQVVEQALKAAQERRQEFATVEHLCLALFDTPRIRSILSQIGVKKASLKKRFTDFIDTQIETLPHEALVEVAPSLGFQRVLQRAAIHIVGAGKDEVGLEHVLVATFDEDESYAVFMMQEAGLTRLDLVTMIAHGMQPGSGMGEQSGEESLESDEDSDKSSVLSKYTTCLTEEAQKGRIDPLIGRHSEVERILQILTRRRKNNPLLVGEPGVGKTALAEGLALRIVEKTVPDHLKSCEMYLLDMGAMLAGTRYRGDFENRMKSVLKALLEKDKAIVVIDEIHTVIGAGSTTGSSMDASNLLKPILSKGQLRCIGSTTYKEYRTYFEKDRALARRFQKIDIEEPSEEESIAIVRGIKNQFEEFHGLTINDEVVSLSVSLSKRYLHEKKLPDKAIDLIDEACAKARLLGKGSVDKSDIEETLALMAQIPSSQLNQDDKTKLFNLKNQLESAIFGQNQAIEKLTRAILLSRAGLRDAQKPIGSFLFSGPSGVGKTEMARQLAQALGINLIRFDMSEYMERHTASRLVGAPPGYVGFDQGGLLTDAINKTPYTVLLLDEIEKAHPDVFNMLLQVMDYGKLTDSFGRVSDFRHVILIMTSNAGAFELEQRSIGFFDNQAQAKDAKAIKRLFSVEFRNRLDAQVTFNKLDQGVMLKVVDKFIDELASQLAIKNVSLAITDKAKEHLAKVGFDSVMGARPLARIIDDQIKKPLATELVFGKLEQGGNVVIELDNEHIALKI